MISRAVDIDTMSPDFCLYNEDNERVCLRYFKGQWVVLFFYERDNTSSCRLEAVEFSRYLKSFNELNAVVIGLSPDSIESHKKFKTMHNLEVTLLSDKNAEVAQRYGVLASKDFHGKESTRVNRSTFLIDPNGRIAYIWRKVQPLGHARQVKDKLKELQGK